MRFLVIADITMRKFSICTLYNWSEKRQLQLGAMFNQHNTSLVAYYKMLQSNTGPLCLWAKMWQVNLICKYLAMGT